MQSEKQSQKLKGNILSFVSVQMLEQNSIPEHGCVIYRETQCSDECDRGTIWDKEQEK